MRRWGVLTPESILVFGTVAGLNQRRAKLQGAIRLTAPSIRIDPNIWRAGLEMLNILPTVRRSEGLVIEEAFVPVQAVFAEVRDAGHVTAVFLQLSQSQMKKAAASLTCFWHTVRVLMITHRSLFSLWCYQLLRRPCNLRVLPKCDWNARQWLGGDYRAVEVVTGLPQLDSARSLIHYSHCYVMIYWYLSCKKNSSGKSDQSIHL